jgi:hypothetical protein
MLIALRRHCSARNCHSPGWNDDNGLRMTLGDSVLNGLTIIRAARRQRRYVSFDLIKQVRYFGHIANIIRRQRDRDDFMRDGIHSEVQFAPPSARADAVFLAEPFALTVNLETRAVDQQM